MRPADRNLSHYGLTAATSLFSPGVSSAAKGHHYAGPTNRFWPCVHQSGLVPEVVTYKDDARLPHDYNIGLTNLVSRPTTAASELSVAADMRPGVPLLLAKILRHRPQIVCFVGKDIWREFRFVLAAAERRKTGKSVKKEQAGWDEPRAWKVVHPQDGAGQVQATYFWAVSSTSGLCRDTVRLRLGRSCTSARCLTRLVFADGPAPGRLGKA